MAKLKVYGGGGFMPGTNKCARLIVAVTNQKEAARLTKLTLNYIRDYWCETGNEIELKVALANPGVVYYKDDKIYGTPRVEDYREYERDMRCVRKAADSSPVKNAGEGETTGSIVENCAPSAAAPATANTAPIAEGKSTSVASPPTRSSGQSASAENTPSLDGSQLTAFSGSNLFQAKLTIIFEGEELIDAVRKIKKLLRENKIGLVKGDFRLLRRKK